MGSGCGSVGRADASDARGPRFETGNQQNFIMHILLFTVGPFTQPHSVSG